MATALTDTVVRARKAAVGILVDLAHPSGFHAGASGEIARQAVGSEDHYASIWARDAGITILGLGDLGFLPEGGAERNALGAAARASLTTFTETQYPSGQIQTVVWPRGVAETGGVPYGDCGETGGIDGAAYYVIALRDHLRAGPDESFRARVEPHVHRAMEWLLLRDDNQEGIINSPQAGDWIESTLVRSGKVLYNNVLLYEALQAAAALSSAAATAERYRTLAHDLRRRINFAFWPEAGGNWRFMVGPLGTPEAERRVGDYPHPARQAAYTAAHDAGRRHYISHIEYAEFVDKCDVLANVYAVLFGVAEPARARTIMATLHAASLQRPCPMPTYLEPITAADPSGMYKAHIEHFQGERWRNSPGNYHNGGIWPYIGGFYVEALVTAGMVAEARSELERLCTANLETDFNEWLNHYTGEPGGNPRQAWNAGTLLRAVAAVERAAAD